MAQYQKSQDVAWAVCLARAFVEGKIRNALALLTRQHRNYPERGFAPYREEFDRLLASIATVEPLDSFAVSRELPRGAISPALPWPAAQS